MLRHKSFIALGILLLLCASAAHVTATETGEEARSGGCTAPAEAPAEQPTSVVDVPDYNAEAPDPREQAREAAWNDYRRSVYDSLRRSSDPRDWALAVMTHQARFQLDDAAPDATADDTTLLERAVRAAPDDALVQWIAARYRVGDAAPSALAVGAAQRLLQLQPNNAALLLDDLAAAARRNDPTAVDAVLNRMSARTGFDEFQSVVLKATLDVYRRHPLPDAYWDLVAEEEKKLPRETFAFVNAVSIAAAVAMPAYQSLVEACRVNEASGKNPQRAANCAAIGRVMVAQGGTFVDNRLGYTLLRLSRAYTDADVAAARRDDWLYSMHMQSIRLDDAQATADSIVAYETDWMETGSELEAIRRAGARAGVATDPPADWGDDSGMFSAERLRADAQRLADRAAAQK